MTKILFVCHGGVPLPYQFAPNYGKSRQSRAIPFIPYYHSTTKSTIYCILYYLNTIYCVFLDLLSVFESTLSEHYT